MLRHTKILNILMVRSFFLRLAALLAPFALIMAFPLVVLWKAGEYMPLGEVAALQRRGITRLYDPAYSNSWRHLKQVAVPIRHPAIAAIGTSRVMQFRSEFFRDPRSFYNAGGAIYELPQLNEFLTLLGGDRARQPRILIVGLDQNFFNDQWRYPRQFLATFTGNQFVYEAKAFQRNWKRVYEDFFHHKISLPLLVAESSRRQRIGLAAIMNVGGFRGDGSFFYAREIDAALRGGMTPAMRMAPQLAAIDLGREQFSWAASVSPAGLNAVRAFVDACRARGIHVVAFLPPFAHAVYARMHGSPHYRYLDRLAPTIGPLFASRGFTFVDCSDLAALGGSDDEIIDGFHASEVAYARLLLRLAREDAALRVYVDTDRLQGMLARAKNPLEVF